MDLAIRTNQLKSIFSYEKKSKTEGNFIELIPYSFTPILNIKEITEFQQELPTSGFCNITDDRIDENKRFNYVIFAPARKVKFEECIILLHGLNEKSWDKYLTWAEYMAENTGKPVILFPLAFHMNRAPGNWSNPRFIQPWVNERKKKVSDSDNLTFANVALSSRLSVQPLRFYVSGKECVYDLWQLALEIKSGTHPLFKEDTRINLFGYSIGALLAQVVLLANPGSLFSNSKLFMFCGGSIFNKMNGNARDIMDREAYKKMQHYYIEDFLRNQALPDSYQEDHIDLAFKMMITPDVMREKRESFFRKACNRIKAISLKNDIVMPTYGIIQALGKSSNKILKEFDLPFSYSHQNPFPLKEDKVMIKNGFTGIFDSVCSFI